MKGDKKVIEPVSLTAIPYYAWNNRGTSNMLVWLPEQESTTVLQPEKTPALTATASASTDWAPGLNDGFDPKNSGDVDKAYFYWWLKEGTDENVTYDFEEATTISESSVYWLQLDHYDGDYRVPQSWELQYKNAKGEWIPVDTTDAYGLEIDTYNTVHFKPVKTKAIRLQAKLQENESAGILEWKVQ